MNEPELLFSEDHLDFPDFVNVPFNQDFQFDIENYLKRGHPIVDTKILGDSSFIADTKFRYTIPKEFSVQNHNVRIQLVDRLGLIYEYDLQFRSQISAPSITDISITTNGVHIEGNIPDNSG